MNIRIVAPQGTPPTQARPTGPVAGSSVDIQARQSLAQLHQEIGKFHASIVNALNKIGADMAALGAVVQDLQARVGAAQAQGVPASAQVVEASPSRVREIANAQAGDGSRLPDVMFEGDE